MTRKHYEFVAKLLRDYVPYGPERDAAVDAFVAMACRDNPRFDPLRFATAAKRSG